MRANRPALVLALTLAAPLAAVDLPPPATDADFLPVDMAEARLGQLLFYDPILSGNDNIACATCHHPRHGTSDGLSLGMGEGGRGLAPTRTADPANLPEDRIPRNSPALFNLAAFEYDKMFHDGRVERRADGSLRVPIEDPFFTQVSGLLATQAAFPVLSPDEMAGQVSENPISKAVRKGRFSGEGGAWELLAAKVAAIPAYAEGFAALDPEIGSVRPLDFADISDAIAAFIAFEFRATDSAFDAHLRGEAPLDGLAAEGMALFYGEAGCAACHSGTFQTDHGFHAMGQPQFGPGKSLPFEQGFRDEGRYLVTGDPADLYAFRTPSLRNVTLTAPYGHSGAYADMWEFVAAHTTPHASYTAWTPAYAVLPDLPVSDWDVLETPADRDAIAQAIEVEDRPLPAAQIDALVAFLGALEDNPTRLGIPETVPSGLPVDK